MNPSTARLFSLFFLFSFLFFPLRGDSTPLFYEKAIVSDIRVDVRQIKEEKGFKEENILDQLQTKVGRPFSQLTFDRDMKKLAEKVEKLQPKIEYEEGVLSITLQVWFKPTIETIRFSGNEKLPEKKLMEKLQLKSGDEFSREKVAEKVEKLRSFYITKGFFESQLSYDIHHDREKNSVDIDISIIEGRMGFIKKIAFTGFTEEEEEEITRIMGTSTYFFLTSWMTGSGRYNKDLIERDLFFATDVLRLRGYADATVDIQIKEVKGQRIVVELIANRGEKYTIRNITFSPRFTLFEEETVRNKLAIAQGSPYSEEALSKAKKEIEMVYGRKGHIEAMAICSAEHVVGENQYDVAFDIQEGDAFRVGLVHVIGNTSTEMRVILNETLLKPGEWFDSYKLQRTEANLIMMDYFKKVHVYTAPPEETSGLSSREYRDIYIEVEEKTTGKIGFSFGFSSTDRVFGRMSLSEDNFRIAGIPEAIRKRQLNLLRGGGENADLSLTIASKSREARFEWWKPHFRETKWAVGFDIDAQTEEKTDSQKTASHGLKIKGWYPFNAFFSFNCHYRIRQFNTRITGSSSELEEQEAKNDGIISAVGASVVYMTLNHPVKPTEGFYSSLGTEIGGLGGKYRFLHHHYYNSYHQPLPFKNTRLFYRFNIDFVQPYGSTTYETLPLQERLFLGGEESVRGVEFHAMGPQYPKTGNPRGGLSSTFASVELIRNVVEKVDVFCFVDTGYVTRNRYKFPPFSRLETFWGYGVRLDIFNQIPISLGMGYPLKTHIPKHDQKKFFFSLSMGF